MSPKISIITINYNNREGLERTFDSVFSQNYTNFEYIVIDGASNDGSKELIDQFSDKITFWVSEPDKGIYNAMNKGIRVAKGAYLLFINSGDELYETNTLEKCAPFLHSVEIISGNLNIIGENVNRIGQTHENVDFKTFFHDTLWHPSTFIKNLAFQKVGFYDENLKIVGDWKWFLTAICTYNLGYKKINETVAIFYLDGLSNNSTAPKIIKDERQKVLNESFPFLLSEYKMRTEAELKLEGYESSRIIKILKKLGFLKGL